MIMTVLVLGLGLTGCARDDKSRPEIRISPAAKERLEVNFKNQLVNRGTLPNGGAADVSCERDPGGERVMWCTAKWTRGSTAGTAVAKSKGLSGELVILSVVSSQAGLLLVLPLTQTCRKAASWSRFGAPRDRWLVLGATATNPSGRTESAVSYRLSLAGRP